MTNEYREELISAALDGERVDVEALRGALSTSDGRSALASFLLLRAAMAADTSEPRTFVAPSAVTENARMAYWRSTLAFRLPVGLAASVAALFAAGAFCLGIGWQAREAGSISHSSTIQTPMNQVVPATSPAPPKSHPPVPDDGMPPTPKRVLRFTPGVDWHPAS